MFQVRGLQTKGRGQFSRVRGLQTPYFVCKGVANWHGILLVVGVAVKF